MITVIQGVPSRIDNIRKLQKEFPDAIVSMDEEYRGCMYGFRKSLEVESDDEFRLHLQDDIEVCDGLADYMPTILADMNKSSMDVVSLYCRTPNKNKGRYWYKEYGSAPLQAIVFRKNIIDLLRGDCREFEIDTHFVHAVLFKNKTHCYVTSNSLVQHGFLRSVQFGDTMSHKSLNYDREFLCK